jgi:hypothetical protein
VNPAVAFKWPTAIISIYSKYKYTSSVGDRSAFCCQFKFGHRRGLTNFRLIGFAVPWRTTAWADVEAARVDGTCVIAV